jgi:hypothetical protein
MAVSLTTNIDKIVFTSPNMPSPQSQGLRSHIVPSEIDLGTWYESGGTMTRVAMAQNIYDISYNTGIDRPVFGISGIVTSGTLYIEGQNNNIYVDTDQIWSLSFPRNVYVDDNSWFTATSMNEYDFADPPPVEDSFLDNAFTSSGTLTSTRDIIINGCAAFMGLYNYIFNTDNLYKYDPATEQYSLVKQCSYDISYPTAMVGISGTLYMFYLDTDNLLIKGIEYNTSTETWATNTNYEYQSSASSLTAINAVFIDDIIKVTLKYSENSIPPDLYTYNYDRIANSWSSTFIATCGNYNLNFNNALIECDSNYIYSLERSSKLLHKIDLNTKIDDQMIVRYETTDKSSTILKGDYLYTYVGNSNKFTKININTEDTYDLAIPTMSGTDSTLQNESTTLSTDGTYLYLGLNKGISWDSETKLYKYNTASDSWGEITAPHAGSVSFSEKMCRYVNNIYGIDSESLYLYDLTNNRWNTLCALPRDNVFDAVIAANATHVYAMLSECGYFWRYIIASNTWEVLQSLSLPAPLSYEGTCPGSMIIDGDTVYLGLNYNHVLATRDTFYYKYNISGGTWKTYTAPKTSSNRSFYMLFYKSGSDMYLAGDISYLNIPVDTYRYKIHKCTNTVSGTWETHKTADINAMTQAQYICMYGQTFINNKIYISFTTATNLGFVCSDPKCRQIDVSAGTSNYWFPNPVDKHFTVDDSTGSYIYCASVDNGILYKYTIASGTTEICSTPRKAFVNYYVCNYSGSNYLLGKQEIEYDPAEYRHNFYIYKDNAGTWDQYDLRQTTFTSTSGLKLNTIQEYYMHNSTIYMAAFLRNTENTDVSEAIHKKYNIVTKTLDNLNIPTLTTSVTASGSGNSLLLAVGNEIKSYNISTDATESFQQGIAGNRASAFPYIYKDNGKLYATSNQCFTPETGGKFITYEETVSGSWSIYDSKNISSTFYNTLDYAEKNNELYIINTAEQMTLSLPALTLEYVSNAPYSTIGTVTSGGIILYNDHYACNSYIYNDTSFTEIPSDVVRTHKSSNLLFVDETMYFTKNSVTNEVSTINVASGTKTIIYDDTVVGDTPFLCNISNNIYMLQPEYQILSTISGANINTIKTNLNIANHTSACSDDADTIYFTKGENYYLFYKYLISSGTLTQLPNLPEYSTSYSSIEYYDHKVYYITSNKMYLFNTQDETWGTQTTLQNQIYSKGIKINTDYIYYCGNKNICKIDRDRPETKAISLSPIPVRHHSAYCMDGTDIYLHYNTINLISECTAVIGDEKITTLDLNNISHFIPTTVPYDIQLISNIEKEVEFSWSVSSTTYVTHYRIYRTNTLGENLTYVGNSTTLSFIDTLADRGIIYYYYIKACNEYGGAASFSNPFQINVAGYSYKYALTVSSWENRIKEINQLPTSGVYIWGNSNLSFTNTVRINVTHGEAYNCYLTAWDDDSHSSTSNKLISNECFRVAAVVFSAKQDATLEEPDIKAMMCRPQFNKILKGNDSYYGKFNVIYEALTDRHGGYIIFKPILINIPEEQLSKGVYLFKAVLHYQYT